MISHTDVTGALGWGIRKYAWLIVLFVVALGVVVPAALNRAPDQFEAKALVGPVKPPRLPNLDVLPRLGAEVFSTVPDAEEVKATAGLKDSQSFKPEELELVEAQDNIVFTVVARDSDPEVASEVANAAAARFVTELNVFSQAVGSFSIKRLAVEPTKPVPQLGGPQSWGLGIASGLLAGLGTVALLILMSRPVIDVTAAGDQTGAPVLGRITLGRHDRPVTGMTQLCHRLLSQPTGMVLMVGGPNTRRARRELTGELARWLSRVRRVIPLGSREPVDDYGSASLALPGHPDVLCILDDASPVEVATRPERSLTLLVIREGISRRELQELAQQYLDSGNGALLMVRRGSVLTRLRGWSASTHRRPPRTSWAHEHREHDPGAALPTSVDDLDDDADTTSTRRPD
jgi:hypothetical protein